MGLWLWDADPKFSFSLADELTELRVELILRGAWDDDADDAADQCAEVVNLAAFRRDRTAH